ncbi:aminotransferase class III-fold pyridoxal phosphate-dependent enzyme [bacterium]|jgi:4-aminobutyrate aminotransferase|nr:aminotransferase class III-fold pyridoxal phosphate-dependent enzyme [bacterium]
MNELLARGNKVLSPVMGHFTQLEIEKGEGCYLITPDGTRYLDMSAGIGVTSTGHCHPRIVEAIQVQSEKLIHACAGVVYYSPNIALAEKLAPKLGHDLSSFFFTQSGSEAVEAALKLARYTQKKEGIIAFKGGFHGRTMGSLSITSSKDKYRDGYPVVPGTKFFPYPYLYHPEFAGADNIDDYLLAMDSFFKEVASECAAVIIEPILGEGGYVPCPSPVMTRLRELCDQYELLLIADEIQTGVGRTGKWFAYQHYGIVPDIVALAKGMASGMPLGACVASPELMAKWTTGSHGGTFGGNPVSCAAGIATLEVLSECIEGISDKGNTALNYLHHVLDDTPSVGSIRGVGLMIAIEFVSDKTTRNPNPDHLKKVMAACFDQKVIAVSCGIYDNVLRLMPALTISDSELMKGLEIVVKAIHENT